MGYVTVVRNKLHGQNNKGSGPQGKYMAGDLVDDTMEPIELLEQWVAVGAAEMSGDVEREAAVKRGKDAIAEQQMIAQKAGAESRMKTFDMLTREERDEINYEGDEALEEAIIKPRRKRGRPRKDETST